ncbi:killer cell lectin-like receptor subfamily B member 1B allele A [Pleurodeles waltl]|uniref:killer cell lectin-like receptor subfamily B member 1B allele A n=1 Tax=Pleurodeles waltl TaxID=8319 RepID=UPI00370957A2
MVLLVLAVVGSGVWIFRLHRETEGLKMSLKQREECKCTNKSAAAHCIPSCPLNWHQHGEKCYFFPEKLDEKSWSVSHEECTSRDSRLAVIEDNNDLDYLTSKFSNQAWIGLFITPAGTRWTWVNGSALNETVFRVTGPDDGDLCGVVNRGSIVSSRCINDLYWICQKEAEMSSPRD